MAIPEESGTRGTPTSDWPDADLVAACLGRTPGAWAAMVAKHERLVYAIIHKSGAATGEEADVFQAVWLDVYNELDRLRNRASARAWIATVTRHKCYHWRLKRRRLPDELEEDWAAAIPDAGDLPPEVILRLERATELRAALESLPERCQEIIRELFLTDPPLPYAEVAARLGLAEGSIGAQRARCLERLKAELVRRGFDR